MRRSPPAENPPQPTTAPSATAAPTAVETAAPTATAAATAAPTATAAVEAPPPPKPGKDKIVGMWMFSFEGEPKAKAEEEAKKKYPKDADQAKRDEYVKKIAETAAGEWIEYKDGYYISHVTEKGKDKIVAKMKYEVTKDESSSITMKAVGKDEISKKEMKDEVAVSFKDDDTISMVDPGKKITLIFKRKK
ncbi:MAG: hypothetical protein IPK82_16970 [Polyangiaceae bacterium]|nr:hypothetical protein [Polyangiaceae bacterium]